MEFLDGIAAGSPWALVAYLLWRNHALADKYAEHAVNMERVMTQLLERIR